MLLAGAQNLQCVNRKHGHAADSPRLAAEAVKPLEAGPPHPHRRPGHAPGEVVEGSAHAHRDGDSQTILQAVDPQLLRGCAEGDQQHVRLVGMDQLERLDIKRRAWTARIRRNQQARVGRAKLRCQLVRHSWLCPEKDQPESPAAAKRGKRLDQVGAGDGSRECAAHPPGRPNDSGAVGQAQGSRVEHPRELPVALGAHHEFGVDGGHQVRPALVDEALDLAEGRAHVEAVDPDTEDSSLPQDLDQPGWSEYVFGSTSTFEMVTKGMLGPSLVAKSRSDSPPPTRTRPHVNRSATLWVVDSRSVVTAVLYPACLTASTVCMLNCPDGYAKSSTECPTSCSSCRFDCETSLTTDPNPIRARSEWWTVWDAISIPAWSISRTCACVT